MTASDRPVKAWQCPVQWCGTPVQAAPEAPRCAFHDREMVEVPSPGQALGAALRDPRLLRGQR